MENKTERLMKMTVVIGKLYHYLQGYTLYPELADLITIVPNVVDVAVETYIAEITYNMLFEYDFDDNNKLINTSAEIIRAALYVKRFLSAGK